MMPLMPRWMPRPYRAAVAALPLAALMGFAGAAAPAEDSKSAAVARELAQALDAAKLEAIAAPDPSAPGTWVAALYFKDSQLLVVSAQYSAPTLLADKMKTKDYRDIYIDLNSASMPGTKIFIIDQMSDGLFAKPQNDNAADTWEEKTKTVAFDGEWRKAKMSEDEYMKVFADADERYAKMLSLLASQAKGKSGS